MTTFTAGKPQTTSVPTITVDAGLAVGFHRFRLVVMDADDNASKPDELVIEVRSVTRGGGTTPTPPPITRPTF